MCYTSYQLRYKLPCLVLIYIFQTLTQYPNNELDKHNNESIQFRNWCYSWGRTFVKDIEFTVREFNLCIYNEKSETPINDVDDHIKLCIDR